MFADVFDLVTDVMNVATPHSFSSRRLNAGWRRGQAPSGAAQISAGVRCEQPMNGAVRQSRQLT